MRFTKPSWVSHKGRTPMHARAPIAAALLTPSPDANQKRVSIFSIHVHPDGSRLATGGLDAKVRIWSTLPILRSEAEDSPKSLCTLGMHSGPVLTVRWSHSGKWLASGSDDTIIMIWDLDPTGGGKVWGSDETNIEGWKALRRLPGHESDVTDLAWSPGDRYLASVGLDSRVIVWCGYSLNLLRRLDLHQGFVKGVCWDPVGQFLATQSDDKSVKIWRTDDWGVEATITKPFEDSPGSTFFRRLSWSPDGAHITASNAMNNNGYVFVAAVISRQTWASDISLVGHENTVEVAAYNPHIFLRRPKDPITTSNICSVVALGSDDLTVSVWQTKSARPLIVAKDVFERAILDLGWSFDGLTLYACSSDGTIGVFDFDQEEMEGIAPRSAQVEYLKMFNFTPAPMPTPLLERVSQARTPPPSPPHFSSSTPVSLAAPPTYPPQSVTVAKNGKRRIKPLFISHLSYGPLPSASAAPSAAPPLFGSISMFAPNEDHHHAELDMTVPITALNGGGDDRKAEKRKAEEDEAGSSWPGRPTKARTLGGDRVRESVNQVKELRSRVSAVGFPPAPNHPSTAIAIDIPSIKSYLCSALEEKDGDLFEARNPEVGEDPTEVMFISAKQTQFLDYLPAAAILLTCTSVFCAVAMEDASIIVYSLNGRRIMPTLMLDAPSAYLEGSKHFLMTITSSARVYVWNIKSQKAAFPSVHLDPFIRAPSSILSAQIRPNGAPLILLSSGVAYSFDPALSTWVRISEARWSEGSDAWEGKHRTNKNSSSRGVISTLESALSDLNMDSDSAANVIKYRWWNAALTLGHLETKLHAAKVLDSPTEYRAALLSYAKKIAEEGFKGKAEELLKDLCGPLYWKPSKDEQVWCPTVLGLQKRDLLKEVSSIFAKSKTLAKLGQGWQDTLRKAALDEF
ncbi:hypothetical protein BOTBODRAFT_153623 [Botryobasidium botryosum FD-172 SS1]|uniref:Protein HIR n=1 Tax=Botryobasidium botryosum (strain FD-172 SS1) TaxID=930990 RepID=A0A067N3Q7_BOTB1|nr:hypothetical protein BOTBODRAFT_153623 [Botryobasidium botryosum FD-172 SS1]